MTFYVTHREAQDRGSARQAGWGGPRPSLAPALLRTARGRIERSGGRPGWPARWPPALAAPVAGPSQPRARLAWPAGVILGAPPLAEAPGPSCQRRRGEPLRTAPAGR